MLNDEIGRAITMMNGTIVGRTRRVMFLIAVLVPFSQSRAQIPADKEILLNGEGAGQASYAESNGYPGPKHVLDLAVELELTARQKKEIGEIYQEVNTRARELGKTIVKIEKELNEAFAAGLVTDKSVQDDTEQIGKLRARLRAVHLTAHLKMKPLLTKKQVDLYRKLRSQQAK